MNSYIREDGVEMVETRPGCFTRRDSLGLLDLAPMTRRANALAQDDALARRAVTAVAADITGLGIVPPPIAPTHDDLAPEPVEMPTLQPSFVDLMSAHAATDPATSYACFAEAYAAEVIVAVGLSSAAKAPKPSPALRPKPAKRSIAAILAEADRNSRARRSRART